MSKILDLAADFETKSTQQASDIEHRLKNEFKRHERHISTALRESEYTISNAIEDQTSRLRRCILPTWLWMVVSIVLVLTASWGVIWYQGQLIKENWITISQQKDTLEKLQQKTFGIRLSENKTGKFIVLSAEMKVVPGWTVGTLDALKLEKK